MTISLPMLAVSLESKDEMHKCTYNYVHVSAKHIHQHALESLNRKPKI